MALRGAAYERSMGLRGGAAWSCTGALPAAVHGCSMGLRMSAAWGCA